MRRSCQWSHNCCEPGPRGRGALIASDIMIKGGGAVGIAAQQLEPDPTARGGGGISGVTGLGLDDPEKRPLSIGEDGLSSARRDFMRCRNDATASLGDRLLGTLDIGQRDVAEPARRGMRLFGRALPLDHADQRVYFVRCEEVVAIGAKCPAKHLPVKGPRHRHVVGDELGPNEFAGQARGGSLICRGGRRSGGVGIQRPGQRRSGDEGRAQDGASVGMGLRFHD